jgi:hypothetical protein
LSTWTIRQQPCLEMKPNNNNNNSNASKMDGPGAAAAANAAATPAISRVDSAAHAESVIKSLRSLSLSQSRYQRNAESSDVIIPNLAKFDSIINNYMTEDKPQKKLDPITAYLNDTKNATSVGELNCKAFADVNSLNLQNSMAQLLPRKQQNEADDSSDDDDEYDNTGFSKKKVAAVHNMQTAAVSPPRHHCIEEDEDELHEPDEIAMEEDKELFEGFVAPKVSDDNADGDAARPTFRSPKPAQAPSDKSKFSSKLNSSVTMAQSYQSNDFG